MNSVQCTCFQNLFKPASKGVITVLLFWLVGLCYGENQHETTLDNFSEKKLLNSDSTEIEELAELAYYYYDYLGDKHLADSICQKAVDLAESRFRPDLLMLAYNRYLECTDPGFYPEKTQRFANDAVKLSKIVYNRQLEWQTYRNVAKVNLAAYNYKQALESSYKALALADVIGDEALKTESYLLIGQSMEGNNQKIESFRNYLNASALAERLNNPELIKKCYAQLSGFYNNNKMYDKAIIYKLRQVDLITKSLPVDSVELMWANYDLQAINVTSNNNKLNTNNMQDVLDFAIRKNHLRLKNYEIALYRTYLINAEKIKQLSELYTEQYPEELNRLSTENPSLYYRLKALFSEIENRPDSAQYYLVKAEKLIKSDPNKILQANFYQRFGQFLMRQGKIRDAITKYHSSYALAREASYFEYMLSSSNKLEALYASIGDYKNAYTYSALNRTLNDSITILTKNDQLLMLEIDHETRQREHAAEQELIQTHRRHNIQYMAITIVTIAMFILLMMLGSLKVPAWTIRMLGFFSFILFFEFIIMIADHKIYEITHNEPWKILLIKIGLIAFLLPFHHWIERKVIHYLIEKKLINFPRFSLNRILKKQKYNRMAQTVPEETQALKAD